MNKSNLKNSLLPEAIFKKTLNEKYGLYEITCSLISNIRNNVYIVNTKLKQYIFKIYERKSRKENEIKGEIELLNLLHDRGAAISYPIRDIEDNLIQKFETNAGPLFGVLFSFAKGKVYLKMNDSQLFNLGKELAVIHNITHELNLENEIKEYDLQSLMFDSLSNIKPAFKRRPDDYKFLEETAHKVKIKLDELNISAFDTGYIQYDISPYNIHFENETVTLFDYDLAKNTYIILDLICIYAHFFNLVRFGDIASEEANREFDLFLDSYMQIRKLPENEIDAIPYLGFASFIYGMNFIYQNFSQSFFLNRLEHEMKRITLWANIHHL